MNVVLDVSPELRDRIRDVVMNVDEDRLRDCVQIGRVPHHPWKPRRTPVDKNFDAGPLV
jgi:hypothetical protein